MGPAESHIRRGWVLLSHTSDWRLAGGDSQLQNMELERTKANGCEPVTSGAGTAQQRPHGCCIPN